MLGCRLSRVLRSKTYEDTSAGNRDVAGSKPAEGTTFFYTLRIDFSSFTIFKI
ncbi:MAG: hypothetical protein ACTSP6_02595 [Promethearchaeota archaeon]